MPAAPVAAPRIGGHFRVGVGHGSTTDSLDPGSWNNQFTNVLGHAVHARLVEIGPDGYAAPDLCEGWDSDTDARRWSFRLRREAVFHDGRPVRAADVVASIDYHRGPDSTSVVRPLLTDFEEVSADGDAVTIRLRRSNADLPYTLADGHLVIRPASEGGTPTEPALGCGPYRLMRFQPGVSAALTKAETDWRDGRGFFASAELLALPDPVSRLAALRSGAVDAIDRVPADATRALGADPSLRLMETEGTQHYTFPMRCDLAPFDDPDVRLALKFALDREALLAAVLFGRGEVGNDSPITPANRFFNAAMPQHAYDPEAARFHLKRAGRTDLKVALSVSDAAFPGAVNAAQIYRENAKAAGIDITVRREPNDGYWTSVWRRAPWCACYWGGRPTEQAMFEEVYRSGTPWNDANWSNARFDALLTEAAGETDTERRRALYFELQDIVRRDGGTVIPLYAHHVDACHRRVATPARLGRNWALDGARCIERWWFSAG
jgi:peptide/nickel transport system substrate-binding protein